MKTPKLPTTKSLEGVALFFLLTGHRISHLAFQNDTHCYCLRAPVFNLRKNGWPVDDCWNAGGISPVSGRRKRFKKYFINEESLRALRAEFGDRLKSFIEAAKRLESAAPTAMGAGND